MARWPCWVAVCALAGLTTHLPRYGLPSSSRGSAVTSGRLPISGADADAPLRLERGNTMQADRHQGNAAGGRALTSCLTVDRLEGDSARVTRAVDRAECRWIHARLREAQSGTVDGVPSTAS